MKLWAFYLKDLDLSKKYYENAVIEERGGRKEMTLYAYTTEKKCAERFLLERNMEKFYYKVTKISNEDLPDMDDIYWSDCKLDHYKLYSGKKRKTDLIHDILMTANEYWYCTHFISENIQSILERIVQLDPALFNRKIRKYLIEIGYAEDYRYLVSTDGKTDYMAEEDVSPLESAKMRRWKNELGFFLYIFRDILNYEGMMEVL